MSVGLRCLYALYMLRTLHPLLYDERQDELLQLLLTSSPKLPPRLWVPGVALPWVLSLQPLVLPAELTPHLREKPKVS